MSPPHDSLRTLALGSGNCGKIAIVATSGIGRAVVHRCARASAICALTGLRNPSRGKGTASLLGGHGHNEAQPVSLNMASDSVGTAGFWENGSEPMSVGANSRASGMGNKTSDGSRANRLLASGSSSGGEHGMTEGRSGKCVAVAEVHSRPGKEGNCSWGNDIGRAVTTSVTARMGPFRIGRKAFSSGVASSPSGKGGGSKIGTWAGGGKGGTTGSAGSICWAAGLGNFKVGVMTATGGGQGNRRALASRANELLDTGGTSSGTGGG